VAQRTLPQRHVLPKNVDTSSLLLVCAHLHYSTLRRITNARRTNASPIYLILFVSATWYLNRPCLYCSLLLTVLVISLYDWRSDWFEPRSNLLFSSSDSDAAQSTSLNQSIPRAAFETASAAAASVMNSTAATVAQTALEGLSKSLYGQEQGYISGAQWLRELVGKKEWRIPCLDVIVRL